MAVIGLYAMVDEKKLFPKNCQQKVQLSLNLKNYNLRKSDRSNERPEPSQLWKSLASSAIRNFVADECKD